jgi:bifunctional enzyme CysN/CysC
VAEISTDKPIVFEAYATTAARRLHPDRQDDQRHGGAGHAALQPAPRAERPLAGARHQPRGPRRLKNQKPAVLWFTGLSGSGKSTIANLVEKKLHRMNRHTFLLDGDNVRHGLNKDLGFTEADRIENIRRVGEVAEADDRCRPDRAHRLHLAVPAERDMVRAMLPEGEFIEVFIDTPLEVAEERDVKGLYKKARPAS